jgi:hypothetical protein
MVLTSRYGVAKDYDPSSPACLRPVEMVVVWSFVYLALRRALELILLCFRSAEAKEIEILVLRLLAPTHTTLSSTRIRSSQAVSQLTHPRAPPSRVMATERDVGGGRGSCLRIGTPDSTSTCKAVAPDMSR